MAMPPPTGGTWDCHVHCFEPDRFPFKTRRAYTPRRAPLDVLLQQLLTTNVMIVQASIEASWHGLLASLEDCGKRPKLLSGLVRGTILADASTPLSGLTHGQMERMHLLGVRCIRLHGVYGGSGHDPAWAQGQITALAEHLRPVQAARNARRDQEIHVYADNQAATYRLSSLSDSPGQQWLIRCLKAAKTIQSKKASIHL
ncbi:hypothetical protein ACJQWK_10153 [Exserohilum turcicum]